MVAKDDCLYVIFDNPPDIVRLGPGLIPGAPDNWVYRERREATGFEDIAYDPGSDRFFALIEALPVRSGTYRAKVTNTTAPCATCAATGSTFRSRREQGPRGADLSAPRRPDLLLAICEGNRCRAGSAGRRPGGGRIQVFTEGPRGGSVDTGTIRLRAPSSSRATAASLARRRPPRRSWGRRPSTLSVSRLCRNWGATLST